MGSPSLSRNDYQWVFTTANIFEKSLVIVEELFRYHEVMEEGNLRKGLLGHRICVIVLVHSAHLPMMGCDETSEAGRERKREEGVDEMSDRMRSKVRLAIQKQHIWGDGG